MPLAEPLAVVLRVGEVLDALQVEWLVGGSLASSLHGIPRATQDVDIVANLRAEHIQLMVSALQGEFYVDTGAVTEAVNRRSSCNVIHLATMTKVDIFALKGDALSRSEMARRQHFDVGLGSQLPLASPEDIILQKLDWFRKGEEVSERQWRDVLGVLQVRGPELDLEYLEAMAAATGLTDLLKRALAAR